MVHGAHVFALSTSSGLSRITPASQSRGDSVKDSSCRVFLGGVELKGHTIVASTTTGSMAGLCDTFMRTGKWVLTRCRLRLGEQFPT